jgi:hypothetical protein
MAGQCSVLDDSDMLEYLDTRTVDTDSVLILESDIDDTSEEEE